MTDISAELSVVIPAYNEQNGIGLALAQLREHLPQAEVIVVDDCSHDDTGVRASEAGAIVLRHEFNRGYGGSLKTGIRRATRTYVAWFDGDNEHRAEDLRGMLRQIMTTREAAVIAVRRGLVQSSVRTIGKMGIRAVAGVLSVKLGDDINCGLRIFRRQAILPYLGILPDKFSASVTSTMILAERGYPFSFYEVTLNPRVGKSKVKISDGFDAIALVLRVVTLFAPLRIFLRAGILCFVTGFLYGLTVALIVGLGVPSAATLLMLTGVLLVSLGLIADQISQLRLNQLIGNSTAPLAASPDEQGQGERQ